MRTLAPLRMAALLTTTLGLAAADQALAQSPPTDPANFQIFILAGQSNMAGRGTVEPQDTEVHPRVWMLNRELEWVPAVDPMHFDKPIAGVGPGRTFGIALAEANPGVHIGLVPTAVGGSAITSWVPGGIHQETGAHPWDEAIQRSRTALERGTLRGILWHQGESDSGNSASLQYYANLTSLIARFRSELNAPNVPFIIGQLGRWEASPWSPGTMRVDSVHQAVAAEIPGVAYIPAERLPDNGDALHFSNEGARALGLRYFAGYEELLWRMAREGGGR